MNPASDPQAVEERRTPDQRRAPERRHYERRAEDRRRFLQTAGSAALAICGGLTILYLFFAALGAFEFEDAAVASAVAVGMACVWFAGYWYRNRTEEGELRDRPDRERRGF